MKVTVALKADFVSLGGRLSPPPGAEKKHLVSGSGSPHSASGDLGGVGVGLRSPGPLPVFVFKSPGPEKRTDTESCGFRAPRALHPAVLGGAETGPEIISPSPGKYFLFILRSAPLPLTSQHPRRSPFSRAQRGTRNSQEAAEPGYYAPWIHLDGNFLRFVRMVLESMYWMRLTKIFLLNEMPFSKQASWSTEKVLIIFVLQVVPRCGKKKVVHAHTDAYDDWRYLFRGLLLTYLLTHLFRD